MSGIYSHEMPEPQCYIQLALSNLNLGIVRFALLTAVTMKGVFWDVTQYSFVDTYQHLMWTSCLHLQENNLQNTLSTKLHGVKFQKPQHLQAGDCLMSGARFTQDEH